MAISFEYDDEHALTGNERLQLQRERQANFRQDLINQAHARHMAGRANFAQSHEGALSPQERAAALKWRHDAGLTGREQALQAHERGMLGDKINGDIKIAHEKRLGMENQGIAVGKLKYGYVDKNGKHVDGSDVLTERERRLGQENAAKAQAEGALNVEQARQKGNLDVTTQQGKDSLLIEQERQGGALDVETKRGENAAALQKDALASQERQVETQTSSAERIAQVQAGKKIQMTSAQESQAARDLMKKQYGLSYGQALAQVRAGAGGQQDGEAWPGYTAEKTAELKRRGYTLVNGKPVKNG